MSGFDALSLWFSFICLRCGCLLWLVGFVFLVGLDCFSWGWVWNSAFTCFVSFCGLASVLLSSGLICLLVVFGLG